MSTPHRSITAEFEGLYDFALDDFQVRACHALADGRGVLVAAPTGAGKTVVGEFAVHLALARGGKCFYTTPIKALSNQKYHDLVARYGPDRVGLLTGDNSINGHAPVVVMTTEVLRNMLYSGSSALHGLSSVAMDEVHYLADRSRGAVWEEVIIHLPDSVSLVSLSATVSNAEEFGEWLSTVRGATDVIVEERRPVPLFQHVMAGHRLHDLFAGETRDPEPEAVVNPALVRMARDERRNGARGRHRGRRQPYRRPQGRRLVPGPADVIWRLREDSLLPALVFIFSRAGCDAAVDQCLNLDVRLTSPDEEAEIEAATRAAVASLDPRDLDTLGARAWARALRHGYASHHAGIVPVFKECVEGLFSRGLVKAVFATETLALGINMPARSVVLSRLSKWNGKTHADVTPGEYTQLTGRAGRRGIDVEGHAVTLWEAGFDPEAVAGLASTRTYPLRSSFRPSYNMAVNLVGQFGMERSRELLESSFAQFQADRAVVGLAGELRKAQEALSGYADAMACDHGDFLEYARLRRHISDHEADRSRRGRRRQDTQDALAQLRVGDVIVLPQRAPRLAVVVEAALPERRDGPRPRLVTEDRRTRRLAAADLDRPVRALTRIRVRRGFNHQDPRQRAELARHLRDRAGDLLQDFVGADTATAPTDRPDPEIRRLRAAMRQHPCHQCPQREDHARWGERYLRLEREAGKLRRRIDSRANTIVHQFNRVCEVLRDTGYLDGEKVTSDGGMLAGIYSELDLVAAESIRRGVWEDLPAPGLAAALSTLVFESRAPDDARRPRIPGGVVRRALEEMAHLWSRLAAVEAEHDLDFLREPDTGFAWAAYRWAGGASLSDVLEDVDLAPGDFVRWVKQVVDLAEQIGHVVDEGPLRDTVRETVRSMRRGVVASDTGA